MTEVDAFVALRAVQIDAEVLDNTLVTTFQAQIDYILDTTNCLQRYKHYFRECITPLFFLPYFLKGQTPGQQLLHIRSNFSTVNGLLNYAFCFLLPTIAVLMVKLRASGRKTQLWYSRVETACRLVDFIHFCFFLTRGGPIRLSERLLGIRTTHVQKPTLGPLNLAGLNRELIGHSFVHFSFLFVPLFNAIKRRVLALSRPSRSSSGGATPTDMRTRDIVRCADCGQTAIAAVRAKRKRNHNGGVWANYCHFCLFQNDGLISDGGDKSHWEMLTFNIKDKQI